MYNSLYADDLDRDKVSTPMTGESFEMGVCIEISFNSLLVKVMTGVLQAKRDRISKLFLKFYY